MVLGIVGIVGTCLYGLGVIAGVLALVFGYRARREIRQVGPARLDGEGQARAGIILGWVSVGMTLLGIAAVILVLIAAPSNAPVGY
jgi:hypothetical protein